MILFQMKKKSGIGLLKLRNKIQAGELCVPQFSLPRCSEMLCISGMLRDLWSPTIWKMLLRTGLLKLRNDYLVRNILTEASKIIIPNKYWSITASI